MLLPFNLKNCLNSTLCESLFGLHIKPKSSEGVNPYAVTSKGFYPSPLRRQVVLFIEFPKCNSLNSRKMCIEFSSSITLSESKGT